MRTVRLRRPCPLLRWVQSTPKSWLILQRREEMPRTEVEPGRLMPHSIAVRKPTAGRRGSFIHALIKELQLLGRATTSRLEFHEQKWQPLWKSANLTAMRWSLIVFTDF
jgi:hypothetical protein